MSGSMIPKFARLWLLKRSIERGCARQAIARQERAKAAYRGMAKRKARG